MGHRQHMTSKERLEWDSRNYRLRLEANKGHNHSYMTDKLYSQLKNSGYSAFVFDKGTETFESEAVKKRDELRKQGHYARVISSANRLRIRSYEVYFKPRIILDPEADGTQWLYRGMGISEQKHPELLPYGCYDWERNEFLIGVTTSKILAKELIDKYINEGKKAIGYIIYHG